MKHRPFLITSGLCAVLAAMPSLHAAPEKQKAVTAEAPPAATETIIVTGKAKSLIGSAPSASKGQASNEELIERPVLRRGELLEVVPGVIITQHSGDGKANQYFVRGYNLDHGSDFAISMDGQPVNFTSHAHAQGWADLNPIIPELVQSIDYWKGPYYAELNDLSTAGAAKFRFFDMLPEGLASFTFGEHNYYRALIADTINLSDSAPITLAPDSGKNPPGKATVAPEGDREGLTYALEYNYYDGPWVRPGNSTRWNGFLKYFKESGPDKFSITGMAYRGKWDSTDQIPERLIKSGLLDRLGNFDNSVRGESDRYSLMAAWDHENSNGRTHADVYAGFYDLDLFSNFTYFLDDPVNGDQFEQQEKRWFTGGEVRREWDFGDKSTFTAGLQTRHDFIDGVGLYKTTRTVRHQTVRVDDVYVGNAGLFAKADWHVNDWFRVQAGVRADGYYFDVESDNPANSGSKSAGIVSPKLSLIFGPWKETEFYINGGMGFHSNDARGVTISRDPLTGDPAAPVDPLVRTYGAEVGIRTEAVPHVVSTLSLWYLHSASELLYVGDEGRSEEGPATKRYGIEWSAYWRPNDWFTLDSEFTVSVGKLLDVGPDDDIPGAVPITWSSGLTIGEKEGPFGSVRARYFSARPLVEDGSVESKPSFQVNARAGYRKKNWEVALECLNILDRADNDIEYYYASRLPGEGADGVDDIHLHPAEPRTFRLTVTKRF